MNSRHAKRTMVPLLMAAAAALALSACSGTASEQAYAAEPGAVAQDEMAVGAPADGGFALADRTAGSTVTQEREVIRTAYVTMRVDDVAQATIDVQGLVSRRDGLISAEDAQVSGDNTYATITAQVPAAQLDGFLDDVSALGTVDAVNVTAQDVTTQVVDLDARIAALTTSIDRMSVLLAEAERIEDLLAIEAQLSARQAELDSLLAQRTYLGDQVAMSAVTITMSPVSTPIAEVDAPGFLSGLRSGWAAVTSAIAVAITAAGFLLPFAIILLVVAVPLIAIAVRQSRRRRPTDPDASDPAEAAPAATGSPRAGG